MPYERIEMEVSDIDWFVRINGRCVHAASGGGLLPDIIIKNKEDNEIILNHVYEITKKYKVNINPNLRSILTIEEKQEDIARLLNNLQIDYDDPVDTYINKIYIKSYVKFAEKGFWSFDKTNTNIYDDEHYHLVAWPRSNPSNNNIFEMFPHFDLDFIFRNMKFLRKEPIPLIALINEAIGKEN